MVGSGTMGLRLGWYWLVLVACSGCGATSRSSGPPSGGASAAAGTTAQGAQGGNGSHPSPSGGGAGDGGDESGGVGGSGGSAGGRPCGLPTVSSIGLQALTLGPSGGVYDGPATVERSTDRDLLLYFEAPELQAAEGTAVRRVSITAQRALPVLPVGAQLWLSKEPAGELPANDLPGPNPARAFSVRDRQGGKLLLGWSANSSSSAAPIALGAASDVCAEQNPYCKADDARLVHQRLELLGDETVTLADGETGTLKLDGLEYDAHVFATRATIGGGKCYPDYLPAERDFFIELLARSPELITAGLPLGEPPSCSDGNDAAAETFFSLYGLNGDTPYVGAVVYTGLDRDVQPGAFKFDVPGVAPQNGDASVFVLLKATPGTFTPPAVGTQLWLDMPDLNVQALRKSQGGELVMATVHGARAPLETEPDRKAVIERTLGLSLGAQRRCDYVELNGVQALWDLVIAREPTILAKSGERTRFELDGTRSEVWVAGYSALNFTIYAVP